MANGFRLQRRLARLTFIGNAKLEGAEVMVRINVSVADVLALQEMSMSQEPQDQIATLKLFGEKMLVSWNLEDENGPIPLDMTRIPAEEAALIISGWVEALGKVPGPLVPKSPDGDMLPGEPIPTGAQ
jgi:hypothetical protein